MSSNQYDSMENTKWNSLFIIVGDNNRGLLQLCLSGIFYHGIVTETGRVEIIFPIVYWITIISFYAWFYSIWPILFSKNFLQSIIDFTSFSNNKHQYIGRSNIE